MESVIKKIFKEEWVNSILVISVFLITSIWWLFTRFRISEFSLQFYDMFYGTDAGQIWAANYQVVAILGVFFGLSSLKIAYLGQKQQKLVMFFLTVALLLQVLGQTTYSTYYFLFNKETPFPSIADIFYFSSNLPYLFGAFYLFTVDGRGRLRNKFLHFFLWFFVIGFIQLKFLNQTKFDFELTPLSFYNLVYLVAGTLYASLAGSALTISKFFKFSKIRISLIFLSLGVIVQMLADMYYINMFRVNLWIPGSYGDCLYLIGYFFIALGMSMLIPRKLLIESLLVILNSAYFIQLIYAKNGTAYISGGTTFMVLVIVTIIIFKQNKKHTLANESRIRLAALTESHAKLQELDKQKTEFLNIAAHQLRTPVSIIRNYVSMVQDGDFGPVTPEVKGVLNNIYDSNQWLVRLADEFLDISRLESGQVKYNLTQGDIAKVVREVAGDLAPKAKDKGLEFVVDSPENLVAQFDTEKMRHVILNFIENSIKYTEVGKIVVKVEKAGGSVVFMVSDTGLGFAHDDKDRLFQKFQRGKNAHEIEVNTSTGLGLYICRKFVEGHGGTVFAKSEGLGQGSEFGFYTPISKINN